MGLNKFSDKDRRRQRLRNHMAKDLASGKYRQRVIDRKRVDSDDTDDYYFIDEYMEGLVDE